MGRGTGVQKARKKCDFSELPHHPHLAMNRNHILALAAVALLISGIIAVLSGWVWQWLTLLLISAILGGAAYMLRNALPNAGWILIAGAVLAVIAVGIWKASANHPAPAPIQVVTAAPSTSVETATGIKEVEEMVVQPGGVVQWVVLRPFCYEHTTSNESALVLTDGAGNRLGWTTYRVNPSDRTRVVRNTGTSQETVTLIRWPRPAGGCGR